MSNHIITHGTFKRLEWLNLLSACQAGEVSCLRALEIIEKEIEYIIENAPKHIYWGAGESECPNSIKAPNGELFVLKCKVCGLINPKRDSCLAGQQDTNHLPQKTDEDISQDFDFCPNCSEKAFDGRICHYCGAKKI